MTRLARWTLPAVLLVAVVVVTVLVAGSVDRSALGRAEPVSALPTGPAQPPEPISCVLRSGASGGDRIAVSGACNGTMVASADCTGDDALSGSAQADVEGGETLTVTIVLPDPHGAGDYDDAALYAQLSRTGGPERWSNRGFTAVLDDDGDVTVDAELTAEVATGTPGPLALRGVFRCELA